MIWQWKAQKAAPYAEDLGTYGDCADLCDGAMTSLRRSSSGASRSSANAALSYPMSAGATP